jgi:hypothetical protein
MPLSVNIILEVVNADVKPTNPDLKLHIRSNGMSGVAYTDWETFIAGGEATGFLEAPKGKARGSRRPPCSRSSRVPKPSAATGRRDRGLVPGIRETDRS